MLKNGWFSNLTEIEACKKFSVCWVKRFAFRGRGCFTSPLLSHRFSRLPLYKIAIFFYIFSIFYHLSIHPPRIWEVFCKLHYRKIPCISLDGQGHLWLSIVNVATCTWEKIKEKDEWKRSEKKGTAAAAAVVAAPAPTSRTNKIKLFDTTFIHSFNIVTAGI